MFRGSYPALITPFRNGKVDDDAFRQIIDWQIAEGTHGLVPVGTTGESPTLSHDEHLHVVEMCVKFARGRVPVIAGCGSNSTAEAVEYTRHAKKVGATAALHVLPYYNRPTQEGQFLHIKAVNDAVDIPILIYNIPIRTGIEMSVPTLARCFKELKNVIGVKDSTAKLERVSQQRLACRRPGGPEFVQLSGEDATALALRAHGGHGCISVTANIAPRLCAEFRNACTRSDYKAALEIQDRLMPVHDALFCETSPGPVKYAASLLGLCSPETRLPLAPISEESKRKVEAALASAGLSNLARAAE